MTTRGHQSILPLFAAGMLAVGVFVVDLLLPLGIAVGMCYALLVLLGLWAPAARTLTVMAGLGSLFTILGAANSIQLAPIWVVITNRSLSLLLIWGVTLFCLHRRRQEERVEQEHDRAIQEQREQRTRASQALESEYQQRKQVEHQLDEQAEQYRRIFESSPIPMWVFDAGSLSFLAVNDAAVRHYGYTREEFLRMTINDLRPPEEMPRLLEAVRQGHTAWVPTTQWKHWKRDGSAITVEVAIHPLTFDGQPARLAVVHDVTERNRLGEIQARLASIIEHSHDGIIGLTPDGTITTWNESAARLFGYRADEVIGQSISILIPPERRYEEPHIAQRLQRGKWIDYLETVRRRKDGRDLHVGLTISPIKSPTGQVIGISKIVRDITTRKTAEEELKRSYQILRQVTARLESIRETERMQIAREIHDQLGASLTAVKMNLTWITKTLKQGKAQARPSVLIEKIELDLKLVEDMIETVKKISTDLRPAILDEFGLGPSLEWQLQDFQKRSDISTTLMIDPPDIPVDPERATTLFRIFQELLTNVSRHAEATQVRARLEHRDGRLTLEVEDNGKGIAPETIFSPRSLGLVGMRERAHQWGGDLCIDQVTPHGTKVSVWIPLST